MLSRLSIFLPTVLRLGLANVFTVALYRLAIRSGLVERLLPQREGSGAPLFRESSVSDLKAIDVAARREVLSSAEGILNGDITYFSSEKFNIGSPPDWFLNPVNGIRVRDPKQHWSRIGDFDSGIGDIKTIWEPSRFDWALTLARAYRLSGDKRFFIGLNEWVSDWALKNPPNTGPNWKCGQETGIRLLQVLLVAYLLEQDKCPEASLVSFAVEHCCRIEPTIRYAIAQNNNHGTSEAAALFIAGAWLKRVSNDALIKRRARLWHALGHGWLENRIKHLVEKDGSFSQYSLNYHRVLLDTLNMVEFWRRELGLNNFSEEYYSRARAAHEWLFQMVDPVSGDGPNLGANDGARLFNLSSTDYRDYRPSVQLGAVLFKGGRVYPEGPWDESLLWLNQESQKFQALNFARESQHLGDGGYVTLHSQGDERKKSWALLRYPNYRFRPSHADGMHFDLWYRGVNVLRDSGSYSYNTEEPWKSYFSSTEAHNTVQFDKRDQMPSLSRFLRGAWLGMENTGDLLNEDNVLWWSGSYQDYKGARHKRTVKHENSFWRVIDEFEGFEFNAVLRWRLAPGEWKIIGSKCIGDLAELKIESGKPVKRIEIVDGWESKYYLKKTKLPVLEIHLDSDMGTVDTVITLK